MVYFLSARIEKIQPATATGLFVGYSVLNGLTLSSIFLAYTTPSIAATFFITAGMFGAMAVYGLVTKRDLSAMGFYGRSIVSTLERYMKCGVGKCGHCCIGVAYVCADGPVFSYAQIKRLGEDI